MPKPLETNCAPALAAFFIFFSNLFLCSTRIVMLWHAILLHAVACRSSTTVIFATQEQAVFNNAKNLLLLDTFQSLNYCLKKFKPRPLSRCMCTRSSFGRVLLNKCQEKEVFKKIWKIYKDLSFFLSCPTFGIFRIESGTVSCRLEKFYVSWLQWLQPELLDTRGVLYTYGFDCGVAKLAKSPLGQFRLPPAPSQPLHSLDYAIFSCANRPGMGESTRFWNAKDHTRLGISVYSIYFRHISSGFPREQQML